MGGADLAPTISLYFAHRFNSRSGNFIAGHCTGFNGICTYLSKNNMYNSMNRYKLEVDTHCHSLASHHALSSIGEMLISAQKVGLSAFALSDHHPSLHCEQDGMVIHAPDEAYFHVFCTRYSAPKDCGVGVFKSVELNILDHSPWVSPFYRDFNNLFDLTIAGVHQFPHLFSAIDNEEHNTEILLNAINEGDRPQFNILTHPISSDLPLNMDTVIRECTNRGIALEVNNSNLEHKKHLAPLIKLMLQKVHACGGRIAVGSDAHMASEVGNFSAAIDLLEEVNFPPELIVNNTLDSFYLFLDELKINN